VKWINYHHLIYFKVIAQNESISKASEILKVGQPALSTQLKNLEDYMGVKLFERKNRRLVLTEEGKVTLEYANKISSLGQELIQVLDDKIFSNEIHLSVGSMDCIPKHLITDIVDLAHKNTGCFLSIYEDTIDSMMAQLFSHQLDLVITDHEVTSLENKKIFTKKIISKPIYAYAAPKYKKLSKNFPYSLDGAPCLVPTRHSKMRNDIEQFFHTHQIRPKYIAETQDTYLLKLLAAKGDGVIFLPQFTIKELLQNKALVKLGKLGKITASYYLAYGKRMIENPALDLILNQDFSKMRLG
jgi:LysR family transcriptional activator of nhaA